MRTRSNARHRLTPLDLFSACGGLTQGLKGAGFRVVGAVDNDRLSVETYSANHPEVDVFEGNSREFTVGSSNSGAEAYSVVPGVTSSGGFQARGKPRNENAQ